ncbi:hypothetical protein HAX54_030545 [Datura stramonium]|uniref:Uncharacterized protein n=1 Tax=Datura stramonium TaxID=4076 RepID=A0ABS8V8H2_DATST|nr:hypothetical protein [Datura stramonium]
MSIAGYGHGVVDEEEWAWLHGEEESFYGRYGDSRRAEWLGGQVWVLIGEENEKERGSMLFFLLGNAREKQVVERGDRWFCCRNYGGIARLPEFTKGCLAEAGREWQ